MFSNSCAMCENQGVFQVEDLPVGTRQFCSEKCFAKYTGLPIQNEGFYGLSKSSTQVPQQRNAENKGKNTINPIEKAGISGMASGATIEGLSALMGAENEVEMILELGEGRNYKVSYLPEEEMLCPLCTENVKAPYLLACRDYDPAGWQYAEHFFCADCAIYLIYDEDNQPCDEDFDAEESDPHPSLYWFVKGEIMEMLKHGDMTQSDLERIVEIVATKAPLYMIDRGMNMAEKLGDRPVWEVLKLSAITRIEIEEMDDDAVFSEKLGDWASEDEETSFDSLKSYFAQLKNQNPDLARKIEYSVKNEDDIPRKEIEEAGFDEDIIEEWVDYIAVQDDNLQPYETCPACEGEGWILTSYTPATRYDPADGDGEDCEECVGTGLIDPADYMDKEGQYYAESFEAETNGDRQLEESIKRTKMSAIRTGLAITTFGIVLWNLWTNKKQEKQISDIMGLV